MRKRILSTFLSVILILATLTCLAPTGFATGSAVHQYYINGKYVSWNDFSSSPNECWAYANNFYNKIWGQYFSNSFNDSDNYLNKLSDSELTLTVEHLKEYVSKAALGSCLRICNSDYLHGSDGWGHSQIIVQKDNDGFTVFEGGLTAYPYCREKYYTWSEYISTGWLGGTYSYIKYIKWPGADAYEPIQSPVEGTPVISSEKTAYDIGEVVTLQRNTVKNTNYYWIVLYKNGEQILSTEMENQTYVLTDLTAGSYEVYLQVGNATGGKTSSAYSFYVVNRIQGTPKVYADSQNYYDGATAVLYRNTVEYTNYHWLTLYRNGEMLLSQDMEEDVYRIENLKVGTYTAYIQVGNLLGTKTSAPCTFVVECRHAWNNGTTTKKATCTESGNIEYVCSKCGETRNEIIPALGHTYQNGVCIRCGAKDTNGGNRKNPFVDVGQKDYYYDAVLWAAEDGITSGVDASHFAPNGTCMRAQVVAFLWRAAGKPEPSTTKNPFTDVSSGAYYYKAVLWAAENGIVYGTSATRFSPNASCTRAQVVCFLYRYQGNPGHGTGNPFRDVKSGSYYYDAVIWAAENGVVYGTDTTHFSPDKTCTRGQVVCFLYRLLA